jgi:peptidoglycan hydrolase-like protein with peptidoglycan-binding domain
MNNGPTLRSGSTGNDVRRLQRILVMIKLLDYRGIDGVFGRQTADAVRQFQQGEGLHVDGIVGPATWSALPADPDTPVLAPGASGHAVRLLQHGLHAYAQGGQGADPGPEDGVFWPEDGARGAHLPSRPRPAGRRDRG